MRGTLDAKGGATCAALLPACNATPGFAPLASAAAPKQTRASPIGSDGTGMFLAWICGLISSSSSSEAIQRFAKKLKEAPPEDAWDTIVAAPQPSSP